MNGHTSDPIPAAGVSGIILAGGQSRRMGRSKAWLQVDGRPMLEVVAGALTEGLRLAAGGKPAPALVIVGAPGQELPVVTAATVVRDDVPAEGPLRGMAAGLAALEGRAGAAYVSSCDVPLLQPAFVARLLALLGEADIVVPKVGGRFHPLAAVYRVGVLPVVEELLASDRRRPFFLFEKVRTRTVGAAELRCADPDLRSLRNLNTPEDYAATIEATASSRETGSPRIGGPEPAP